MEVALVAAALMVAFVNGANDNMKGVATLYGSGVLSYGPALALATVSTGVGSLASLAIASGLVHVFSAKGIVPEALVGTPLLTSVAIAAALTVLLATRVGFPISTTHALAGGIVGAGFVAAGSELHLGVLAGVVAVPLVAGPLLAAALAGAGLRTVEGLIRRLAPSGADCVCLERGRGEAPLAAGVASGGVRALGRAEGLVVYVDHVESCARLGSEGVLRLPAAAVVDRAHLVSASLVGFARGLNDTPKILGLFVGAAVLTPSSGAIAIAIAMGLGGLVAARRVAETMARKITAMTPAQGLVANLSTALLVIGASRLGMAVSTTHVSTGGIVGIGQGGGALRWRATLSIFAAWLTTLPVAALLGALAMWMLA